VSSWTTVPTSTRWAKPWYELLTLEPAFAGTDRQELLRQIAFEEARPPRRLNKAIPAELETIVLKALEKNPADRYGTAQELADDLRCFLDDKPIRARRPGVVVRVQKWAQRHRAAVTAAAVCVLVTLAAGIGSAAWVLGERAARQREAEAKVQEAFKEAVPRLREGDPQDPALVAAVQRAKAQLDSGTLAPESRGRVEQLLRDLEMLAQLEKARLQTAASAKERAFDYAAADRLYAEAFAWYGLDVIALESQEAAQRVRASAIGPRLTTALDDWASTRDQLVLGRGALLRAVADLADDDPWRRQLRQAVGRGDRAALSILAEEEGALSQRPGNLALLARALRFSGRGETAERLLRRVQPGHAADFWVNFELAFILSERKPPDMVEAVRFYQAALALQPHNPVVHSNLGVNLEHQGKRPEAVAAFRRAIDLKPDFPLAHFNLGIALRAQGRLDEAVAAYRRAIKFKPDFHEAHDNLGIVLADKRDLDGAIAEFREAIAIKKDNPLAHANLGIALRDKGQLDEAIAEFREALAIKKDYAVAHVNLGLALSKKRRLEEAIAECREAIRIDKDYPEAHINLGLVLAEKGDLDGAIAEFREATRLKTDYAEAHFCLGNALAGKGRVHEAIAELREAIRLKKDYLEAHHNLGNVLKANGQLDQAIEEYRTTITLAPKSGLPHTGLGNALANKGQLDESIREFRAAIDLDPKDARPHGDLGRVLALQGRFSEAREANHVCLELLPPGHPLRQPATQQLQQCEQALALESQLTAVLEGKEKPADDAERLALAWLCQQPFKKLYAASARFYAEALTTDAKLAGDLRQQHRYNAARAASLAGCGQGKDAADLGEEECARLRHQALDWLRADLAASGRLVQKEPDKARPLIVQKMQCWLADPDFAGVRGEAGLAKLPEAEREAWRQLWADVENTLAKARGRTVPKE
jgi:tetratricopeptide (TPR) repeat protein